MHSHDDKYSSDNPKITTEGKFDIAYDGKKSYLVKPTYYELLGFKAEEIGSVNPAAITKAFRTISLTAHPDKGGDSERYRHITEAHETLLSLSGRGNYNKILESYYKKIKQKQTASASPPPVETKSNAKEKPVNTSKEPVNRDIFSDLEQAGNKLKKNFSLDAKDWFRRTHPEANKIDKARADSIVNSLIDFFNEQADKKYEQARDMQQDETFVSQQNGSFTKISKKSLYEEALNDYEKALFVDPKNIHALLGKARASYILDANFNGYNNYYNANECYQAVLNVAPDLLDEQDKKNMRHAALMHTMQEFKAFGVNIPQYAKHTFEIKRSAFETCIESLVQHGEEKHPDVIQARELLANTEKEIE